MMYLGDQAVGIAQSLKTMGIFKYLEVHSLTVSGLPGTGGINLNSYPFVVEHELGVIPDFVLLYPKQRIAAPPDSNGLEIRVIQFAIHVNIGGRLQDNAYTANGFDLFLRQYTNGTNSKYFQWSEQNIENGIINTLTEHSVQIGGKSVSNTGLMNGEYWVIVGKIANDYQQGNQIIYSNT